MGMYTEVYFNVDLKKGTSKEVVDSLIAFIRGEGNNRPLCCNMSYYTPCTSAFYAEFDDISNRWSLLCKGDLKNYSNEIEAFIELLRPHVEINYGEKTFIGYMRYEENVEPTLFYVGEETN